MAAPASNSTTVQYPIWISGEKYIVIVDELSTGPLYYFIQRGGTHIVCDFCNFNEDHSNVPNKDQREYLPYRLSTNPSEARRESSKPIIDICSIMIRESQFFMNASTTRCKNFG